MLWHPVFYIGGEAVPIDLTYMRSNQLNINVLWGSVFGFPRYVVGLSMEVYRTYIDMMLIRLVVNNILSQRS